MSNDNKERFVITVPDLVINNNAIKYCPESIDYTYGLGVDKVRVQTIGGGAVETTFSQDITEAYSIVKFELVPTVANQARIPEWKGRLNDNSISLTDPLTGFSLKFSHAVLVNDPSVKLSSSANIEFEFHCDQAQ